METDTDLSIAINDTMSSELIAVSAFRDMVKAHGLSKYTKTVTKGTALEGYCLPTATATVEACESAIGDKFTRWWASFKTELEDWRLGAITAVSGIVDVFLEIETIRRIHKIQTATDNATDAFTVAVNKIPRSGLKHVASIGGKTIEISLPPKATPEAIKAAAEQIRATGGSLMKKIGIKYWIIFFGIIALDSIVGRSIRNTPRALENILALKLPTTEEGFKAYSWKVHDILHRDTAFSLSGEYFDKEAETAKNNSRPLSVKVGAAQVTEVLKANAEAMSRYKKIPDKLLALGNTPEAKTAWGAKAISLLSSVVRIVIDHSVETGGTYKSFLQRLDKMNDSDSDNKY